MLESKIQKAHMDSVKAAGGMAYKLKAAARRNVPDCLDLYGVAASGVKLRAKLYDMFGLSVTPYEALEVARITVGAAIQFTECKQPGKRPTAAQEREHTRLRDLGFVVNVEDGWMKVVLSDEDGDCPGPMQEGKYEYREDVRGQMWARKLKP